MHEVGHTLGLRHNFRASRVYTEQQLADPAFTREQRHHRLGDGLRADQPGAPRAARAAAARRSTTTLGPVRLLGDRVRLQAAAVERHADEERAALKKIAARSAEPQLAYGTDEDNFLGIDPESLQFDLGDDVSPSPRSGSRSPATCSSARRRRSSAPTRTTTSCAARSAMRSATSPARRTSLARQIGGVRTLRDAPGTGRDPLQPVPAPSSARRSTSSPAACSRPTACASRRHCSAGSRPTSPSAAMRSSAATARPRPTTRRPGRCSACSARCWPC